MAERLVVNSGPLIALARADALEVAAQLQLDFVCPPQVRAELDAGEARGHPAVRPGWLAVVPLAHPLDPVAAATLDLGEAAVIQLAREQSISRVCIDDWKARRAAVAVGLRVTGSLGLLARAKSLGVIPEVRPVIDRLLAGGGWFDAELVRRVLRAAGE
ncbi:MAG: DUF3368 domain-containing protein [Deltaproteobacteria bacterium]|nr:DUF3368 domain-containing protein [Deltaproteobacteria bacterium]